MGIALSESFRFRPGAAAPSAPIHYGSHRFAFAFSCRTRPDPAACGSAGAGQSAADGGVRHGRDVRRAAGPEGAGGVEPGCGADRGADDGAERGDLGVCPADRRRTWAAGKFRARSAPFGAHGLVAGDRAGACRDRAVPVCRELHAHDGAGRGPCQHGGRFPRIAVGWHAADGDCQCPAHVCVGAGAADSGDDDYRSVDRRECAWRLCAGLRALRPARAGADRCGAGQYRDDELDRVGVCRRDRI